MKKTVTAWIVALVLALTCMPALATVAVEVPTHDRAGNAIQVPETVETIVSLAPSITQVLADIGEAEKLVAIDKYSMGIDGVDDALPTFDIMTPDMEQIVALEPDVVFVSGMSLADGSDPLSALTDMGYCVAYIPSSSSIDAIMEDNLFIGQVVGRAAEAQKLNDALAAQIEEVRVQTDDPVPVFFEIGFPYSFGSGTFLDEMIDLLGGRNIFADQEGWIVVSDEAVIAAAPEIIFTNADWDPDAVANILAREGWEEVPAVKNGRVYLVDGNASSQPNHRIIYALQEMAEAFAEYEK